MDGVQGDEVVTLTRKRRPGHHQAAFDRMHYESKKTAAHNRSVGLGMNERGEQVKHGWRAARADVLDTPDRVPAITRKANPARAASRARRRRRGW